MVVMFVIHFLFLRMGSGKNQRARGPFGPVIYVEPNSVMRCAGRSSHRPIDRLFLGLLSSGIDSNEFDPAGARAMPGPMDQLFLRIVSQRETTGVWCDLR